MFRKISVFALMLMLASNASYAEDEKPGKLPLPRFVSLRSDEANLRTGPGVRYPIKWVIKKETMPVEIIAEYEDWRKIRDIEQDEGWLHKAMLSGHRTAIVKINDKPVYKEADNKSGLIAKANKGTILTLEECQDFCKVKAKNIEGYTTPENLYGLYENEKFKK